MTSRHRPSSRSSGRGPKGQQWKVRRQTERMPSRIEQYPPPIRPRLNLGPPRTHPNRLRLTRIQIVHHQIEMHVIGRRTARPGRWLIPRNPKGTQRTTFGLDHRDFLSAVHDFTPEQLGPERRQGLLVRAMQRDQTQPRDSHVPIVRPRPATVIDLPASRHPLGQPSERRAATNYRIERRPVVRTRTVSLSAGTLIAPPNCRHGSTGTPV